MPDVYVNATQLYYRDDGAKELPPLLCLHSLFLDGTMFDELAEASSGRYRIIRPDFRGQGKSSAATSDIIDMDTLSNDLESFIDELGLKDINVVVQSMGGDVVLRLLARRPELFRSVALLGTSACNEPSDQLEFVEGFLKGIEEAGFIGEHLDTLMEIMFGESSRNDPAKKDTLEFWRKRMGELPLTLLPAMRGVVYRETAVNRLSLITTPALIISGAEDMVRPGAWQDEMAHELSIVKHIRIPRVGHSVILEAPKRTISEIMLFMENLST